MGLIDADKVLNIVAAYCPDDDGSCSKAGIDLREMLDEIEALPEIDAEPIKHGHWIIIDDVEKFIAKCSECGRVEDTRWIEDYPYCHCGAKMDLKDGETK